MHTVLCFVFHYTAEYSFLKNYSSITKFGTNAYTAITELPIFLTRANK